MHFVFVLLMLVLASVDATRQNIVVLRPEDTPSLRSHMAAIRPDYSIWRMFRILRSFVESRIKRPNEIGDFVLTPSQSQLRARRMFLNLADLE